MNVQLLLLQLIALYIELCLPHCSGLCDIISGHRGAFPELGIDLLSFNDESLQRLMSDDALLVDLVSWCCTSQIKANNLDERGFAALMVGGTLDDALNAIVNELVFISRPSQQAMKTKAWEKIRQAELTLTEKAVEVLDSPRMERAIESAMRNLESQLGS